MDKSANGLAIRSLTGGDLAALLPDLAALRITVFRAWPYLYDGDDAYERRYLASYADAEGAVIVGAFDGPALIGAATGAPLSTQPEEWRAPLRAAGLDASDVFYCGESVLSPAYRGRGVGHAFFDHREAQARALGLSISAFCGVMRPADHPLAEPGYRPLDGFWRKRGYAPLPSAVARFSWRDVGETEETEKPLQFWSRRL